MEKLTKVSALKKLMIDNGGKATWEEIYKNIEKYYSDAKDMKDWQAGLRGVLYREIRNNKNFKQIGLGIYALLDYKEEEKPKNEDTIRMHSYIQGICLELGNLNNFFTYVADPNFVFKDNVKLHTLSTLDKIPEFTYSEIINEVKRIDVIWFNKGSVVLPKKTFEVVDSLQTLEKAFNRSIKLFHFQTEFKIIAPKKFEKDYEKNLKSDPYYEYKNRFVFKDYETITQLYDSALIVDKLRKGIY
jgi:hypothetical protein